MSRFLITGLPRSRTAWFAVATGARHEPIGHHGIDAVLRSWKTGGISDACAAVHVERILDALAPRTLIIERPLEAVAASFWRYVGNRGAPADHQVVASMLARAQFVLTEARHPAIKRVEFKALGDIEVMRECFAWLRVNEPRNLRQLIHMNIQSDLAWNLDQLARRVA